MSRGLVCSVKNKDGLECDFIFRDFSGSRDRLKVFKNKEIGNDQIIIIGSSGSGKSIGIESVCECARTEGYTVVVLTEKKGDEFVVGEAGLKPVDEGHLGLLKNFDGGKGLFVPRGYPVRFYHPFVFKNKDFDPKKFFLPVEFFTFGINNLHEDSLTALFGKDEDKVITRLVTDILNKLGDGDNLFDLIRLINDACADEKDFKSVASSRTFWTVPRSSLGSSSILNQAYQSFGLFKSYFFLQNGFFDLNLDMRNVLFDKDSYHVFSVAWVRDKRVKYFVILELLCMIQDFLGKNKGKVKLCLVFDEIKSYLPSNRLVSYMEVLADKLRELLDTVRRMGCMTVSATQSYFGTCNEFRDSCNVKILMSLNPKDLKTLKKDFDFTSDTMRIIEGLKCGEYVLWESRDIFKVCKFVMPCHRHLEPAEDLFVEWKKEGLPVKNFLDLDKRMRDVYKKLDGDAKEKYLLLEKEKRLKKEEKDSEKLVKKKVVNVHKESMMRKIYEVKKEDFSISWSKMGVEFGCSDKVAKKYCKIWARRLGDKEFLEKLG